MTTPAVSILIATLNGGARITKTIESIFAQTLKDIEVLIIDDASTDGTPEILEKLRQKHPELIRVERNAKNLGVAETSRLLLERATGTYAARLDDDDYYTDPKKLEEQVAFLEGNPDHTLVGTWCTLKFPDGRAVLRQSPIEDGALRQRIYQGTNPFVNSTVLFHRDAALRAGGYRAEHDTTEDLDLFLGLGRLGKMAILPKDTLVYTISEGSLSAKKRWKEAREMIRVLHRHHKHYKNTTRPYPFTLLKIILRQFVAAVLPRTIVMRLKYLKKT